MENENNFSSYNNIKRLSDEEIVKDQKTFVFVDSLGSSEVVLGVRGYCKNEIYWDVRWRIIEKIKLSFDREGVEIPYQQMTVHIKE